MPFQRFGSFTPSDPIIRVFKTINIIDAEVSGEVLLTDDAFIRSANYEAGTAGFKISYDGTAEFNDVTIRGDIESSGWDGDSPADLSAGSDSGATTGFYLDSSAGAAQFEGNMYIGGTIELQGGYLYTNTSGNVRTRLGGAGLSFYNASDVWQGSLYYDSGVDALLVASLDLALEATHDLILTTSSNIILPAGGGTTPVDGWIETDYSGATGNWLEINAPYDSTVGSQTRLIMGEAGTFYFQSGATIDAWMVSGKLRVADGAVGSPSLSFNNDSNTGIYSNTADQMAFATGGTMRGRFYVDGLLMGSSATLGNVLLGTGSGSAAAPNYTFYNDKDTGMYRINTNQIAFSGGGTIQLRTGNNTYPGIRIPDGDGTVPGLCFASDTDTGIYRPAGNQIAMLLGGVQEFLIGTTGFLVPNVYNNASAASNIVYVDSDGNMHRATSARKYKAKIKPADHLADVQLQPISFRQKGKPQDRIEYGFIADDIAEQDELLGVYDEGELENYLDRGILAVLAAKVNRLEARVRELENA